MSDGPRPKLRDDLALMEGYHSPQVEVEVRLNTNEAPEPPPPEFTVALQRNLESIDWHRYPERAATELRSRIAEVESPAAGQELSEANVFAANGSNEVLQSLCLAYAGAGRSVLTNEPTYALHSHIARITGAEVKSVDRNADFAVDVGACVDAIAENRPAIVFLCSPNNPTGMVDPPETVESVLDAAKEVGALLIVDEAYGQFAPRSSMSLVGEDQPLVVTRTFSKTWSAAALRLGYLVGPSWVVRDLETVVLPYHLDTFKQAAGLAALEFSDEMQQRVSFLVEERGRVEAAMAGIDLDQWPSGSNFILFRPRTRSGEVVWQDLVDRGVLVRNCASWPGLKDCLRLTLGTAEENDRFLAELATVLA